jgi:hypothetical protein
MRAANSAQCKGNADVTFAAPRREIVRMTGQRIRRPIVRGSRPIYGVAPNGAKRLQPRASDNSTGKHVTHFLSTLWTRWKTITAVKHF